jgi:uncharacterized protein YndB with AHSA1/START domain
MAVSGVGNSSTFKVTTPSDREIQLTRLFDAPRALVFEAMTKPEHVRYWWGRLGDGYSVPECEIDLRPGGRWRFVNLTPKNIRVVFAGVYREIVPPERLVFTENYVEGPGANPDPGEEGSLVTTLFTEEQGKTRMTVTARYPSVEIRDIVLKSGMERGAAISYDRLEEVAMGLSREA